MAEREPMTQTINMNDAQRDFGRLVNKVAQKETRVLVEDKGKRVAALVSPEDLDQLQRLDLYRHDPWRVIDEIHARNAGIDPVEAEGDIAEAIAEMRHEERQNLPSDR